MNHFVKGMIIATLVMIFDQWSKYYVFELLSNSPTGTINLLPFMDFVKVYNYGVSFGLFSNLPYGEYILSFIAIVIVIILIVWLCRVKRTYLAVALGLIIGGAVGNIVDRVRLGAVADFIDVYVGVYHWPAFNVADSAVCMGVIILLIDSFITNDSTGQQNDKKI